MLIDEFLPEYDFSETHAVEIRAGGERVFRVLNEMDLCESPVVRWLFRLRGLPAERVTLRELRRSRFEILGERPGRELLLGLAGKFWTPTGSLRKINAGDFREFNEKGCAKAVWDFSLAEERRGETSLTTETRIKCADAESRLRFGFYWALIRPLSGLIRRELLKTIKKRAEETGP